MLMVVGLVRRASSPWAVFASSAVTSLTFWQSEQNTHGQMCIKSKSLTDVCSKAEERVFSAGPACYVERSLIPFQKPFLFSMCILTGFLHSKKSSVLSHSLDPHTLTPQYSIIITSHFFTAFRKTSQATGTVLLVLVPVSHTSNGCSSPCSPLGTVLAGQWRHTRRDQSRTRHPTQRSVLLCPFSLV